MNTHFNNSYGRDLKKITDKNFKAEIKQSVLFVKNAKKISDILPELRKLKGYGKGIYYRIKVGSYRTGVTIVGDLVTFLRFLPRKDFYKYFP